MVSVMSSCELLLRLCFLSKNYAAQNEIWKQQIQNQVEDLIPQVNCA